MVCCIYINEYELKNYDVLLPQEIRELLDEVRKTTSMEIWVERKEYLKGFLWWKKKRSIYSMYFPTIKPEFQIMNFGLSQDDDSSIGHWTDRQGIAGYLFGVLNGYRHANKD